MFRVGDRLRVVTQFNQSGSMIPVDTIFTLRWQGSGSQVAAQFEEANIFLGMHTCSGACDLDTGFWVYRYHLNDNCILAVADKPTWVL
jgi:hypothetical protein